MKLYLRKSFLSCQKSAKISLQKIGCDIWYVNFKVNNVKKDKFYRVLMYTLLGWLTRIILSACQKLSLVGLFSCPPSAKYVSRKNEWRNDHDLNIHVAWIFQFKYMSFKKGHVVWYVLEFIVVSIFLKFDRHIIPK